MGDTQTVETVETHSAVAAVVPAMAETTAEREPIADQGSLSDHEATYSGPRRTATEEETDDAAARSAETGRVTPRHRARKDLAGPADVPRIRELTKKHKAAEELAAARATEAAEWKAKYDALQAQAQRPAPVVAPSAAPRSAPTTFDTPEPKLEDFASEPDPYAAWLRAANRWDRQKEQFEAQREAAQAAIAHAEETRRASEQAVVARDIQAYTGRLRTYLDQHPDRLPALQQFPEVPALMGAAIVRSDNGPDLAYTLQQRPELFAEMHLLTDGKPVSDANVATTLRWLQARVQTGSTGAVAAAPQLKPLPAPPTPVRTGAMTTGGSEPPDDKAPLSAHEAFFHTRRR